MNAEIELHDSDLAAVSHVGDSAVLSLRPAYIHRSTGRPGRDAGSGWLQHVTLTFDAASVSSAIQLPATISDGSLRLGDEVHDNCIPIGGSFDGHIELRLLLATSESLTVRGDRLTITLHGEATYVEEFTP